MNLLDFKDLNDILVQGDQIHKRSEKNYFLNADEISRHVIVFGVLVELDFTQKSLIFFLVIKDIILI